MVKSFRNSRGSRSSPHSQRSGKTGRPQASVRIIGGQWRGSKLSVVDAEGLRPTSDRVRETLFNWLASDIVGARCVDLFAGTGALGIEALSRGAASVDAFELDTAASRELQASINRLSAKGYSLHRRDAFSGFADYTEPVDILFIDPPFDLDAWDELAALVAASCNFSPGALIYLEQPKKASSWSAPPNWHCSKSRVAGDVRFELYVYGDQSGAGED